MRLSIAAAIVALGTGTAGALTYSGAPLAPADLQQAILSAVGSRLLDASEATVRDLRPSKARNGQGYCGAVSLRAGGAFEPFHVILEQGGKPAVLILPEQGDPPGLSRDQAAQLLANFGCSP